MSQVRDSSFQSKLVTIDFFLPVRFFFLFKRFGTIISTKAILDKNTNKCKGYGFVDFESPSAAESAVKALQLQGIQAQMAKVIVKVIKPSLFS